MRVSLYMPLLSDRGVVPITLKYHCVCVRGGVGGGGGGGVEREEWWWWL